MFVFIEQRILDLLDLCKHHIHPKCIKKASSALGHPVLSLSSDDGTHLVAKVCDPNNPTANTWSKTIANDRYDSFDYQFLISNLKLLPGDYKVNISNKLISSWKSPIVEYWIALEKTSTV